MDDLMSKSLECMIHKNFEAWGESEDAMRQIMGDEASTGDAWKVTEKENIAVLKRY